MLSFAVDHNLAGIIGGLLEKGYVRAQAADILVDLQ